MRFLLKGTFSKIKILDEPCIIDIETSWNHETENPVCWMVSAQCVFNGNEYFFRKPSELMGFLGNLVKTYDLNNERRMLIFIHNQSYDLSYLLPYIQMMLPYKEKRSVIMVDNHKIVNYRQGGLDFRCSFLLTHKSLEKLGEDLNVEHKKKIGFYDYDKIHFQDDFISDREKTYDMIDVISLSECIKKQLSLHSDTTATIPLTQTGYIRRKLRASCRKDKYYRQKYFTGTKLTLEQYQFCINSYSGGYTHNNRFLRERIIKPEDFGMKYIKHRDFRSHYPSQMRTYPLPLGKCTLYYDAFDSLSRSYHPNISFDEILSLSPNFYTITKICINSVKLRDESISMPFMQESKLNFIDGVEDRKKFRIWCDNGRILRITPKTEEDVFIELYVSGYTLEILRDQYEIDGYIEKVYRWMNKPLPECLSSVVDELFKAKTDLKYKVKECEKKYGSFASETIDAKSELMISKEMLNAIYGCCCMRPVRDDYDIDFDLSDPIHIKNHVLTDSEIETALEKYYSSRNNFLPYQMGCAITELAKYELYQYIKMIGYENVIYCDTDSIFYLSNDEIEERVEGLNQLKNKTAPYIIDEKGNKIYYDVFEDEPDVIAFKGLHSKCYGIIIEENGKNILQATIAGVPSKTLIAMDHDTPIYLTREEELSGITPEEKINNPKIEIEDVFDALDHIEENMVFRTNTGTSCNYIIHKPEVRIIDGHEIETSGGAIVQTLDTKTVKNIDLDDNYEINFE